MVLALITASELAVGQDVVLHGVEDLFFCGSRGEVQFGVEGVEIEDVAVGGVSGWTGAVVADLAEVVDALAGAVGELFGFSDGLVEFARLRGEVVEDPMGEGPAGGVRVGDDEREALGAGGRRLPGEWGRVVGLAGAGGELVGDGAAKAGAFQLDGGDAWHGCAAIARCLDCREGEDESSLE